MRVGDVRRTSILLEAEFWTCLGELAAGRRVPLATLVNEVAAAKSRPHSLASALRVFALREARRKGQPPARLQSARGDA
jgi:predicted DNA-binding ribbon-helix-helix protein